MIIKLNKIGFMEDYNLVLLFGGLVLSMIAGWGFQVTIMKFYGSYFGISNIVQYIISFIFFVIVLVCFVLVSKSGSETPTGDEFDLISKSVGLKKTDQTSEQISKNYSFNQMNELYKELEGLGNGDINRATQIFNKLVELKEKVDDSKKEAARKICDDAFSKIKSLGVI